MKRARFSEEQIIGIASELHLSQGEIGKQGVDQSLSGRLLYETPVEDGHVCGAIGARQLASDFRRYGGSPLEHFKVDVNRKC